MSDEALTKLLIAAGVAGLGIAALSAYEKRQRFREFLRLTLSEHQIQLVSAEQGRVAGGQKRWKVTVFHASSGVALLFSDFPANIDAYGTETAASLAALILDWYGV